MENTEENKKKSNIIINTIIVIFITIICFLMYSKYLGTKGIRVHEYRIASELIPSNFSGIKLIYFSDFLYSDSEDTKMISEAIEKINELKPDIVLFGGGLISENYKLTGEEISSLTQMFTNINATLGKYAVTGYEDTNNIDDILSSSGFTILNNKMELIYNKENTPICLVGIGSYLKGYYDLNTSFEYLNTNPSCYTIAFTHESDIIEKIIAQTHKPNVILAGNTLGGEINIPFYGGLFRHDGSMNYYEETYNIDGTNIYISSGFGVFETGMRFNNKPSFNFFRLKSTHKNQ